MIVMGLWLGGPLFFFFTPLLLCLFGTATQLCYFVVIALVLALHPLPNMEEYLNKSTFSMWLCKCLCFCLPLLMSALALFLRVLRLPPSPALPPDARSTPDASQTSTFPTASCGPAMRTPRRRPRLLGWALLGLTR